MKNRIAFLIVLTAMVPVAVFSQQAWMSLVPSVVSRVIDGDTLELVGGERVRLIGVDAPELNHPGGREASAFVRELVEGRMVWLEPDGANRDRFGRLRRYVWLRNPSNTYDTAQIRRYQLNALLIEHGHARVMIVGRVRNDALFRQLAAERGRN